jgi:hydroxysqualene dehydroxylase
MSIPDVIVIGAGVAGFSAATALAERGACVRVVDARPMLGGRATSHRDPVTGETVDNGQHIFMGCYRESLALLRRIGTESLVRLQPALEVTMVDTAGAWSTLSCPTLPSPWHLLGGVLEWEALGWRDRLSVLGIGPAIRIAQRQLRGETTLAAASPDETVENWLIRNRQSARIRELLWDPLALAAMNQPPSEAGATAFVRVLAQIFGSDPRDAAIGLPVRPLTDVYVNPARAYIEARGGTVTSGALAQVVIEKGAAAGVRFRRGDTLSAGAVISTVPWHALPRVFDHVPASMADIVDRAARMKGYPIVTVNLWLDRRVLDQAFVGLPGREMQWVFDKRAVFDGAASHVSLVASGAAHLVAWSNERLIAHALAQVRAALPRGRGAALRHGTVVRERNSTFSVAPGEPRRPACSTPLPGFYLAGDWTETTLPGTIESAALGGHRAAKMITGP